MIQEEFKDVVFTFAQRASIEEVGQIFLFGSVAEGDADRRSDIDVLVVFDTYRSDFEEWGPRRTLTEIALDLEKKFDRDIQIVFTNNNFEGLDGHFIEEVTRKGILLFSKSPAITIEKLPAKPYALILFHLRNLDNRSKMQVKRALYGYRTRKMVKGKVYENEKKGLIKELQGTRAGSGVMLVPQGNAQLLEQKLREMKIAYRRVDIWLGEDGMRRLKIGVQS